MVLNWFKFQNFVKVTVFAEISASPRKKRPPKTVIFQRGSTWNRWGLMGDFSKEGVHETDGVWWVIFQRGEYIKPNGFWWVSFQRGEYIKPNGVSWVIQMLTTYGGRWNVSIGFRLHVELMKLDLHDVLIVAVLHDGQNFREVKVDFDALQRGLRITTGRGSRHRADWLVLCVVHRCIRREHHQFPAFLQRKRRRILVWFKIRSRKS